MQYNPMNMREIYRNILPFSLVVLVVFHPSFLPLLSFSSLLLSHLFLLSLNPPKIDKENEPVHEILELKSRLTHLS